MERKRAFIPPDFSLPVAWAVDLAFPALTRLGLGLESIDLDPEDRRFLRTLRRGRLIYMSNHPSTMEPPVAYHVANLIGARFNFMASRTVFNWYGGLLGELIRRVGAFSVLPGAGDRESIRTAREILARPDGKFVIYPEGMMSGENDNLLPFQPGAVQLAFWGLEDARKRDPSADIPVLPAFVKYILVGDRDQLAADIEAALARIEAALGIDPQGKGLLRRFLTVGRVLLENAERDYRIPMASQSDYEYRVGRARHATLDAAASALGIELDPNLDAIHKIRELFAAVEAVEAGFPGSLKFNPNPAAIPEAKRHMDRAYTFLVTRREYLLSRPTAERFVEWLTRFETVVFGSSPLRPRRAKVMFARPFYIGDYYEEYKENRRRGVEAALGRMQSEMQTLLKRAELLTPPIVEPYQAGEDLKLSRQ